MSASIATEVTSEWMTTYVGSPLNGVLKAWCLDHTEGPIIIYVESEGPHKGGLAVYRSADQSTVRWDEDGNPKSPVGPGKEVVTLSATMSAAGLFSIGMMVNTSIRVGQLVQVPIFFHGLNPTKLNDKAHWTERMVTIMVPVPVRMTLFQRADGTCGMLHWQNWEETIQCYDYGDDGVNIAHPTTIYSRNKDPNREDALRRGTNIKVIPGSLFWIPYYYPFLPKIAPGYFFQYTSEGKTYVRHISNVSGWSTEALVTGNPQSFSSISLDKDGTAEILVGTDQGLYHMTQATFLPTQFNGGNPAQIYSGNVSHVRVSSKGNNSFLIWLVVREAGGVFSQLGYIEYQSRSSFSKFTPVARGDFTVVSPSISSNGELQRVLYADSHGDTFLLEQGNDKVWTPKQLTFTAQTPTPLQEETSYVTHVKFTAATIGHEGNRKVGLTASSNVTVRINEKWVIVGLDPIEVMTDDRGRLEIVNPSLGLATPRFTIMPPKSTPGDSKSALNYPPVVDPAASAWDRLKAVKSWQGLEALNIFTPNTQEHLEPLYGMIDGLRTHMQTLPASGLPKATPTNASPTHHWGWWQDVRMLVDTVEKFEFEAEHIIVHYLNEVWSFLVSTFEQAWHGLETIFHKAGAGIEQLRKWLGYVFSWTDIVDTQKSLSAIALTMIDCGPELMDHGIALLDKSLDSTKDYLTSNANISSNDKVLDKSNTKNDLAVVQAPATGNKQNDEMSHPAIDYLLNRIDSLWAQTPASFQDIEGIDMDLWSHTIPDLVKDVETHLTKIKTDLADVFHSGGKKTIKETLATLGQDILATIIDVVKTILTAMTKSLKATLESFGKCLKQQCKIAFLTSLYQHATSSPEVPSILDLMTFIVAIPVTILNKLTNVSMPKFSYEQLKGALFPHQTVRAFSTPHDTVAWNLYTSLYTHVLKDMTNCMANISASLYGILLFPQLTDNATPANVATVFPKSGKAKLGLSALMILLQASYIPIMEKWEEVYVPETRFKYWGSDCFFTLFDVTFTWANTEKVLKGISWDPTGGTDKVEKAVKGVSCFGGLIAFILMEVIAFAEQNGKLDSWTSIQKENADKIAHWTQVEALLYAVNRIASPWVPDIKDPKFQEAAALTVFTFGAVSLGSSVARNIYTVNLGDNAPPGPMTTP